MKDIVGCFIFSLGAIVYLSEKKWTMATMAILVSLTYIFL